MFKAFLKFAKDTTTKGTLIFWITFISSIVLTILVWQIVRNHLYESTKKDFTFGTEEIVKSIESRMLAYEQVLKGGKALFASSDEVSRKEWYQYVKSIELEKNFPGIQGLGFTKVVYTNELKKHENEIRREGFPTYKLWPMDSNNLHSAIIYLEPFDERNKRAFGYDMYSEPTRRKAMANSRDKNETQISGKVILVQEVEEDVQNGFLMYLPFYKGANNTLQERRNNIYGWVYSPFRVNNLMKGIIHNDKQEIVFVIYDGDKKDQNLLYSSSKEKYPNAMFKETRQMDFRGKVWTLVFYSSPAFEKNIDQEKALLILIGGIIISFLVFLISVSFANSRQLNSKMEQILESTGEGIYGIDVSGNCIFINNAACKMLGYPHDYIIGKNMHNLIHYKKLDGELFDSKDCQVCQSLSMKKELTVEDDLFWKKGGIPFPVEYSANPIIEDEIVKGAVVAFNDITERKKTMKDLEVSLNEKIILLKEVHHRVKNNLQIISSLLNLQSFSVKESSVRDLFKESQNRISSMALIHEKLYQTNDMSHIVFSDYVKELVLNLFRSYQHSAGHIQIKSDLEEIVLSIDTSITLGLITNELISNSLKHAFPDHKNGEIILKMSKLNEDEAIFSVKDNGIGLPEDFDYKTSPSLGFQLIVNLVEQISGEIQFRNNNGTEFDIRFPIEKEVN